MLNKLEDHEAQPYVTVEAIDPNNVPPPLRGRSLLLQTLRPLTRLQAQGQLVHWDRNVDQHLDDVRKAIQSAVSSRCQKKKAVKSKPFLSEATHQLARVRRQCVRSISNVSKVIPLFLKAAFFACRRSTSLSRILY